MDKLLWKHPIQKQGLNLNKKLLKAHIAQKCKDVQATKAQLYHAGKDLILTIYGKSRESYLNTLRCKRFMEKVAGKAAVQTHSLQPTDAAAEQHFCRVYHQVQTRLGQKKKY